MELNYSSDNVYHMVIPQRTINMIQKKKKKLDPTDKVSLLGGFRSDSTASTVQFRVCEYAFRPRLVCVVKAAAELAW